MLDATIRPARQSSRHSPLHSSHACRVNRARSPRGDSPDGRDRSDGSSKEFAGSSEIRPDSPSTSSSTSRRPPGQFRSPDASKNLNSRDSGYSKAPSHRECSCAAGGKPGRTEATHISVRSGRFPCVHDGGVSRRNFLDIVDSSSISTRRPALPLSGRRACEPRFVAPMHGRAHRANFPRGDSPDGCGRSDGNSAEFSGTSCSVK